MQYLDCVGFIREYHDWVIDEGGVFATPLSGDDQTEDCFDGVDNNEDGDVDCADKECACASQAYPFNRYSWNPGYQGQSYERFDEFYSNILANLGGDSGGEICANLKGSLPRLSGGSTNHKVCPEGFPVFTEFKPISSPLSFDESTADQDGDNFGCPEFPINIFTNDPELDDSTIPASYIEYADWVHHFTKAYAGGDNTFFKAGDGTQAGQEKVNYVEIWNEQERFWFNDRFKLSKSSPCHSTNLETPCEELVPGDECYPCSITQNPFNFTEFSPAEYGAMASMAFDGYSNGAHVKGSFDDQTNVYDLGAHYAGNAAYVFGGLSEIDEVSWNYVEEVNNWCIANRGGAGTKVFPFDVLNFHHYSDQNTQGVTSGSANAVSPESDYLTDRPQGVTIPQTVDVSNGTNGTINISRFFKHRLREMRTLADEITPGLELWLSEFGYDTNDVSPLSTPIQAANGNMPIADRQEVQGRWLVRSYLEVFAAGWDRAMQFCIRDEDSTPDITTGTHPGLFKASGLVKDFASNHAPKKSYYYVNTFKNKLTGKQYSQELNAFEYINGNWTYNESMRYDLIEPRKYLFKNNPTNADNELPNLANGDVVVVWLPSSTNNSLTTYRLYLPNYTASNKRASLIEMVVGDRDGRRTQGYVNSDFNLDPENNTYYIEIPVSERPIYIELGTSEVDPILACPNNIQATGVSCDAVELTWENVNTYDGISIYYYEKNDSEEGNTIPAFDIGDPAWKIFTTDLPGNANSVLVTDLKNRLDNYFFYIEVRDDNENISDDCTTTATTLSCSPFVDPSNITVDLLRLDHILDYPQDYCITPNNEVDYMDATIKEDESYTFTFTNPINLEGIKLYDESGVGELIIEASASVNSNDFVEIGRYLTVKYREWARIVLDKNTLPASVKRIRFSAREGDDYSTTLGKIIFYGKDISTGAFPEPNCCGGNDALRITGNNSLTTLIDNGTLDANPANRPAEIAIQGILNIDTDDIFQNGTFFMEAGSEIKVTGNSLFTLENMNIKGCDLMWKGIKVTQGGIIVEGSSIQDAEEGIFINTAYGNSITVTNSRFIANKKGVIINYPSNLFSFYALPGVISSTEFNGTDFDLKDPYPSQQNWTPNSQIGFEVNQLASEYLITGTLEQPSFFRNLPVGIGMKDARLSVNNTKFDNIRGASSFGEEQSQYIGPLLKGFRNTNTGAAIWSNGSGNLIVEGLGIGDKDEDMFRDVGHALLMFNTQFSLSNAKMFDVDWGVRSTQFNISGDDLVEGNRINYNNVGMIFTNFGDHTTTATGNTLFNGENKRTFGIYGLKFSGRLLNQSSFNFTDNIITLRYGGNPDLEGFGIGVLNANKANIQGNTITAFDYVSDGSTNFAGININNSDDATICSNEVTGWNTSRGTGINVKNSMGCKVNCNTVDLFREGLRFVGNCETVNGIAANTIGDTRVGLQVEPFYQDISDEAIGTQFHTGNRWVDEELEAFDVHAKYLGDFANLDENRITVTQGELYIDPEVVDPDQWFAEDFQGGDLLCNNTLTDLCANNQSATVEITPGGTIDKLAKKEKTPAPNSIPLAEYLTRKVSDRVVASSSGNTPLAYQSFMIDQQQSQAGALGEIDENWSHIGSFDPSLRATIREKEEELSALESDYRNLRIAFAALDLNEKMNYLQSGIENELLERLFQKSTNLNSHLSTYSLVKTDLLNDLKIDNGNVYTTQTFRNSEKTVNNFAINLVKAEDVSELLKWIEPIAAQCPKEGGVAVFKARTLMSILTGFPYQVKDDCPASKKEAENKEMISINPSYRVFPNPADGFINIVSNAEEENGLYQLYNAQGQLVKQGDLVATQTKVSTSDLPAGLYIMQIDTNNEKSSSHNLVIIH